MKVKLTRTVGIVMLFLWIGCQSILDVEVTDNILPNSLETATQIEPLVTGMYGLLQDQRLLSRDVLAIMDIRSDDIKLNNNTTTHVALANYEVRAGHPSVRSLWKEFYRLIQQANSLLDRVDEDAVDAEASQLVGETYLFRALSYFYLVNLFAQPYNFSSGAGHQGVPLITTFNEVTDQKRSTVGEVYSHILQDVDSGIRLMNLEFQSDRWSLISASAFSARIHMMMEQYDQVLLQCDEVINSSETNLSTRVEYISSWLNGEVPDGLLQIINTESDPPGIDNLAKLYTGRGTGEYLPTRDLLSKFDSNDIRVELFQEAANLDSIYGNFRINKYPNASGKDNISVIRLAEVYLMRAEAKYFLGREEEAKSDLIAIHRMVLEQTRPISENGTDLLQLIQLERRKELMYEGFRLIDLLRFGKDLQRSDCTNAICSLEYPNSKFILPIPEDEIKVNPNIEQNPGY